MLQAELLTELERLAGEAALARARLAEAAARLRAIGQRLQSAPAQVEAGVGSRHSAG